MTAIGRTGTPRSAHDPLVDIRWKCAHCPDRQQHEWHRANDMYAPGGKVGGNPCKGCSLHKYGYGGEAE